MTYHLNSILSYNTFYKQRSIIVLIRLYGKNCHLNLVIFLTTGQVMKPPCIISPLSLKEWLPLVPLSEVEEMEIGG